MDTQPEKVVPSEESGKSDTLWTTDEPNGIVEPKKNTLTGKQNREARMLKEGLEFLNTGKKVLPAYGRGKR